MMQDVDTYDGLGLADLVRRREVSPEELLEQTIANIEQWNPALNALVTPLYDQARAAMERGLPEGPFRGVPFALKELVVSIVGAPTTAASRLLARNMPSQDSEIVRRYRAAGLVIVGKTNSSEFGIAPATEPNLFGVTRNPWNLALSPGGSSGGAAAAVAARMLPIAHATDGGGSIRIPAACCGLFGLKPTRGRVSPGPESGEGLAGLAHQHAVTRSVRDSAALLDAVAGPMPGDPYFAERPERPFLEEVGRPPGRLRIGFSIEPPRGGRVDRPCAAAAESVARLCESLGHSVEEAAPDFEPGEVDKGFVAVFFANTMANIARATGGPLPDGDVIEALTRAAAERGRAMAAADYILHIQRLHRQARRIAQFHERYDLWLTPTLAMPPRPLGWFDTSTDDADEFMSRLFAFTPFTYLCNVTGQPAMSVPLEESDEGVPIGVHFAAGYGEEAILFRLAAQLEAARPWADRRPPS